MNGYFTKSIFKWAKAFSKCSQSDESSEKLKIKPVCYNDTLTRMADVRKPGCGEHRPGRRACGAPRADAASPRSLRGLGLRPHTLRIAASAHPAQPAGSPPPSVSRETPSWAR